MTNIAVLGHGVVGSGVVEVIKTNFDSISKKAGKPINVKRILDLRTFDDLEYADKFTKNFEDILSDGDISIVVEAMGGVNPAFDFVTASLKAKKSVVTSNKELVAAKGAKLLALAKENNVNFFFEASVGGGIPIIRPMHHCLAANDIDEISGILNGTTNFILTKMVREKMDFNTALKLAQDLGYAESDPTADVQGHDACRKICILSSLAFGRHVYPEYVYAKGITEITLHDLEYANNWGGAIKLIANAKLLENGLLGVTVEPTFVPFSSQLSSIDDVFNGVLIKGNATGDVVFYGKGAGKLPTASAVVADVIEASKSEHTSKSLHWDDCDENIVADYKKIVAPFYIRAICADSTGAINMFADLAGSNFTAYTVLSRAAMPNNEAAIVTSEVDRYALEKFIQICKQNHIEVIATMRVATDDADNLA